MRFKQIADILDWVVQFHADFESKYRQLEEGNTKERAVLLLDYLADHQAVLAAAIKKYEKHAVASVMHTWFDQIPDINYPEKLQQLTRRMSGENTVDIVNLGIVCHNLLIEMYQELLRVSVTPAAQELFQTLVDMEQQEKLRMVRDAAQLEDI